MNYTIQDVSENGALCVGSAFKSSGEAFMTLLVGVLAVLLFIAVIYILFDRVMAWLEKQGGFTIRIEASEDDET